MEAAVQQTLFEIPPDLHGKRKAAFDRRNDPMFLRDQFEGKGRYGIPIIRKQRINLDNINLIACTNTIEDDEEYFDFGVHFFVDDYRFEDIYNDPEATLSLFSQYRFCCSPDFSVYGEMQPWRQLESVAHSRWVGAWWQSKGMTVVPTISWDKYPSYEYCFDGVEEGAVVAVATYACRQGQTGFLRGYAEMLERIRPEAVICYGEPFLRMGGNIIVIPQKHPRLFHREIYRRSAGCRRASS